MSRGPGRVQRAIFAVLQEAAHAARGRGEIPEYLTLAEIVSAIGMDPKSRSACESVRRGMVSAHPTFIDVSKVYRQIPWRYTSPFGERESYKHVSERLLVAARAPLSHAETVIETSERLSQIATDIIRFRDAGSTRCVDQLERYYDHFRRQLACRSKCCSCAYCVQATHLIAELDEEVANGERSPFAQPELIEVAQ